MDANAARMMADLGLARRDHVSAPEEHSNRRVRVDPREQAEVQRDVEARRAKGAKAPATDEDDSTARINAWNSKFIFCSN